MELIERITIAEFFADHRIVLPTPSVCRQLLQHAKENGIAVGELFVVSRRMSVGYRGGYERATGNIWCHYDANEPNGDGMLLQTLLILLASMQLQLPEPSTIAQDWENERIVWRFAQELALRWECPELLSPKELEERLSSLEQLSIWHMAVGELVGSRNPLHARAAYDALRDIRRRMAWDDHAFTEALFGTSAREEDNAVVLTFDRTGLRGNWSLAHRTKRDGPPFGEFTLPYHQRTAYLLREALEAVAARHPSHPTLRTIERPYFGDTPLHLRFFRLQEGRDLPLLLSLFHSWLVEEAPHLTAEVSWWLYADRTTTFRLYRLFVRYKPTFEDRQGSGELPAAHDLWILLSPSQDLRSTESALQRYILCWRSVHEIRCEAFDEALPTLWGWLNQIEQTE
jgi:hypothetical protein